MLENSIFSSFATKTVVSYAAGFVWKMIDDGKTVPSEHTFDPLVAVRIAESNDCRVSAGINAASLSFDTQQQSQTGGTAVVKSSLALDSAD